MGLKSGKPADDYAFRQLKLTATQLKLTATQLKLTAIQLKLTAT